MRRGQDNLLNAATPMGGEILAHDWSATSLGPVEGWPVALRSLVALMLSSPNAMFLAWGPELRCIYNDAYRPILGYRADGALGQRFPDLWADIWHEISPMVDTALSGKATAVEDMLLDLRRGGVSEDSWWSFSYSPAFDDDGRIAGMFCVTAETTGRVVAERERAAADDRLQQALAAGNNIGAWDWDVVNDRVRADSRFAVLYGVDPVIARNGAPIADFFAGIHPDDLPALQSRIGRALDPAGDGILIEEYRLLGADGAVRWVSAQGRCSFDRQGRPVRLPGVSFDITARKLTEFRLFDAKAERDFVLDLSKRQRALDDPESIMRLAAQALGERLRVNRTGFFRMHGPDRIFYATGWNDGTLPPLIGDIPVDVFGDAGVAILRAGKPLVSADFRHDDDFDMPRVPDSGVRAGIGIPLLREGRWEAGFYINHAEVRAWKQGEIDLASEVAELTWVAVERAEALLRLQAKVGRQEVLLTRVGNELDDAAAGRAAAEGQVRQLQKMEAVGQLTGGIAHDFNNMLAVVIGGLDMIGRRLARGNTDVGRYLDAARDGADRAASLTKRLLAFARQSPLSPEPIEGNRLVAGLRELLGRTLGERVELETILAAGLWRIEADVSQVENVLVNLAVNARDAMPDGGKLTIETANAHIGGDYAADADIAPGQYVMFAVTDTGTGMADDVLAKAFDPFFTTKEVGKGTGLGLSQVFGFVRQSHGHVRVYSEVGVGTTVRIYLPRYYGGEPIRDRTAITPGVRGGNAHEVVLVVEDEPRVRAFSTETLRELGYTVLSASDGSEALALIEGGQRPTLLFTDVVMPRMTGRQLADAALAIMPELKILYTTGYTRNAVIHNGVLDPGTQLLSKPFGVDDLARKVRYVLDGSTD